MPNIDFLIHDDEWAYEGVCHYSIRKGDKGDRVTPPVADAVDDIKVLRVDAWGVVIGDKVQLREASGPSMSETWKGKIKRSRLLMERLEELCEEDIARGSDAN
jgi:hypothetical protein